MEAHYQGGTAMDLEAFLQTKQRDAWIKEPGLKYYVARWAVIPDVIILKNCMVVEEDGILLPYRRFIRKYAQNIPFVAEQVLNYNLARYYEILHWLGKRDLADIPSYASPLTLRLYGHLPQVAQYNEPRPSEIYRSRYGELFNEPIPTT